VVEPAPYNGDRDGRGNDWEKVCRPEEGNPSHSLVDKQRKSQGQNDTEGNTQNRVVERVAKHFPEEIRLQHR
jgi:hypothetical protein